MIKQLHLVPVNFLIFSNSGFGQNQDWEHLPVSVFLLILRTSQLVYINLKIHFSAGVVLETHLCRATCHRHDAGLERLLLLLLHGLHGLHGRLVWISLRKFTTTPGRGGAGGMLDVFFFLWGPWNHKKPMFFTTKTKKVMNGDLIKWLDGLVIIFFGTKGNTIYIYIYNMYTVYTYMT